MSQFTTAPTWTKIAVLYQMSLELRDMLDYTVPTVASNKTPQGVLFNPISCDADQRQYPKHGSIISCDADQRQYPKQRPETC